MASKYYGTKGNNVIEIQKQLNKLGANLKVDGIWGKNTEAAYNTYKDYVEGTGASPDSFKMLSYDPLSDEQIQNIAKQQADTKYDYQLNNAKQDADYDTYILEQKAAALTPQYDLKIKALQDAYAQKRKELSQTNLSKGMGRSSYAKDVQDQTFVSQQSDTDSLKSELNSSLKDIDDQINKVQMELLQDNETISSKKQADMLDTIASLQKERQNTLTKIIEYNNSLALKLKKLK